MKITVLMSALILFISSCGPSSTESTSSDTKTDSGTAAEVTPTTTMADTGSVGTVTQLPEPVPFSKEVKFRNLSFKVVTSGNQFTLTPSGYTASNTPVTQNFEGTVADVLVDDIDNDNYPEVAVVTRSGADSTGQAYVYSSNGNKSMSMVNLPEKSRADLTAVGYEGRDEFNFVESSFVRRFPKFKDGAATGHYHQIQYKLKAGEASKQLVSYKEVDF